MNQSETLPQTAAKRFFKNEGFQPVAMAMHILLLTSYLIQRQTESIVQWLMVIVTVIYMAKGKHRSSAFPLPFIFLLGRHPVFSD